MTLRRFLRDAGHDPVMQQVQDRFFDSVYWESALSTCQAIGISQPLSIGVVYDSRIHGSWVLMRDRTNERFGSVTDINEENWFKHYIDVRQDCLANHSNTLLHRPVYRQSKLLMARKA